MILDIASIVFVCVTMNHLGLIGKIEELTGKTLPIINCPKCGSFWFTLFILMGKSEEIMGEFPLMLAMSFLSSYLAIWLELLEGYIDYLYDLLYDKIYSTTTDEQGAANDNEDVATSTMPDL